MPTVSLAQIYRDPRRVIITAHRGFSGRHPENTLPAFAAALETGAEIIEYDLQPTRDLTPVVIHDDHVDRTTDGHGDIAALPLAEVKQLNASWWAGSHVEGGHRLASPSAEHARIPTFAELLDALAGRIGMNIHVKTNPPPAMLAEICRLFRQHDLYTSAYLSMSTYTEGLAVRQIDGQIPLCILEDQSRMDAASIHRQHQFGSVCAQLMRSDVTPEICALARSLGLPTHVFWANDAVTAQALVEAGVQGLLTDWPDRMHDVLSALGRR